MEVERIEGAGQQPPLEYSLAIPWPVPVTDPIVVWAGVNAELDLPE